MKKIYDDEHAETTRDLLISSVRLDTLCAYGVALGLAAAALGEATQNPTLDSVLTYGGFSLSIASLGGLVYDGIFRKGRNSRIQ